MENIQKFFKNKKVLITGQTGFKGSWLTKILLNFGAKISGIALKPNTDPNLFTLFQLKKDIRNYFCDIRNFIQVKEIISKEKPEIVLHLAAQPLVRDSYDDPLYTFQTNIIGTVNVLQAIKETGGVKSAVIITTDKVYENKGEDHYFKEEDRLGGYDPYSSSKAGAEIVTNSYIKSFFNPENYNKKHRTLVASARSGNVLGGGDWLKDRIIPDIIRAIFEKKEKLILRNPNSIRPWQYVLEPLYGYILIAKKLYEGKKEFSGAWNFGPEKGNYLTVKKLVEKVLRILKNGSYAIERDFTKHESEIVRLNINKAKKFLKWRPVFDINKTLELTFDWYKSFYNKENIISLTDQQIKLFFDRI